MTAGSSLYTEHLDLGYADRTIVQDLCLRVADDRILALLGPNGSGKSTILKGMARILKARAGAVYLDGEAIHRQPTKRVARKLAILPQGPEAPEGLTVAELVSYGRFPYQRGFGGADAQDLLMVDWALKITGMTDLASRPVGTLSGGQRQRAWIAMALAQGTKFLLLDEPITFLDVAHQLEVLRLLRKLNAEEGRTVAFVVHDLNLAARFADQLALVQEGKLVAFGPPAQVLTRDHLKRVFGVDADILTDPRTGSPVCVAHPLEGETGRPRDGGIPDQSVE